jgi:hypothetical protein
MAPELKGGYSHNGHAWQQGGCMNSAKPVIQVGLVVENEVLIFLFALHLFTFLLIIFSAIRLVTVLLLLPLLMFSIVRAWKQHVLQTHPMSILEICLDSRDQFSVVLGSGVRKAARLYAYRNCHSIVLLCISVDGLLLARTVVIGRRSATPNQLRYWKVRLRQIDGRGAELPGQVG